MVVLLRSLFFVFLFYNASTAGNVFVTSFTGQGGKNTRPFYVKDGWEIHWDAKGDIFQLYLYTADGDLVGVPANQQGSGKGSSYQAEGGQFYLQANALGNWSINIVQVVSSEGNKNENSSSTTTFTGSGGKNTRPFKTTGPWEIQWHADGDIFQLFLYSASGEMVGVPANQQGSGDGSSYQPKKGNYYLQVNAIGNWSIRIVPVK